MKLRNVRVQELLELKDKMRVTNARSLRRLLRCGMLSRDHKTRKVQTTPFGDRVLGAMGKIGVVQARRLRKTPQA